MAGSKGSKGRRRPPPKRPSGSARPPGTGRTPSAATPAAPAAGAGAPRTKPTRTERIEDARRARKRKAMLTRGGIAGAVALVVAVVAVFVISDRNQARAERDRLTAGSCTFDDRNDPVSPSPNNHVAPASYEVDPPSGGNHAPGAAPAGDYSTAQRPAPPDPQVVHALEHGYVAVWIQPNVAEEDLTALRDAVDPYSRDVLLVPRPSLKQKVSATAWGKRLLCSQVEPARIAEFVKLYRNKGPEKVPHP